ncbi:hypothetical protein CXB51_015715 [Gossypium anomalum]|uniref:RING-type domain-containing protein n=1 Tax=Gossypium anomalum TaxID=47600 RepID=A0A8J5Z5R6_9ROSI|nr:hypothetical protein CXB51_015715 [Gossypium anomalum]
MEQPICPCPFIMPCFPAEDATALCCSAASLVISKLFHAIFIFIFSVVGATLGAMVGAFVGAKTKIGWLHGATVGAIRGSFFSIKLFEFSLIVCSSDDMATSYFFQPINAFDSAFNGVPRSGGVSKESIRNMPTIIITEENVWDSSRNPISCSICLQNFMHGEIVHSLPHCHHMFHISCIEKWLVGHKSCPLCRRNV